MFRPAKTLAAVGAAVAVVGGASAATSSANAAYYVTIAECYQSGGWVQQYFGPGVNDPEVEGVCTGGPNNGRLVKG